MATTAAQAAGTIPRSSATAAGVHLGRRKLIDRAMWIACGVALTLVVAPLLWIVVGIVGKGISHWRWTVLSNTHADPNQPGLLNALIGTFSLTAGIVVLGGVVGMAGGLWLAEYCPHNRGRVLRTASDVLAGVPSIALGYVGYVTLVTALHWRYGLLPAWIIVGVLVVPYVVKSTEVAIRNVPTAYREGAEGLGLSSTFTLRKLILRPALPGIATGLIFAAAISVGETAPLLYTAGWADHTNFALLHSNSGGVGYLTYAVYDFLNEPSPQDHILANDAALILLVLVLVLIVASRALVSLTQKYSPDRSNRVSRRRS